MSLTFEKFLGQWQRYKAPFSLGILIIVYAVGLIGLNTSSSAWFLRATPITLALSAAALLWNHKGWNLSFAIVIAACLLVGFFVEVAGVATGVIFGEYYYGDTLGPTLFEVPVMIAVNWLVLVYCTGSIVAPNRWPVVIKAAVSAALMTGLDVLIEPVAIKLDFWHWGFMEEIPMQNYLAWFIISFVLHLLYHFLKFDKQNKLGFAIFVIQIIFFGTLNLIL